MKEAIEEGEIEEDAGFPLTEADFARARSLTHADLEPPNANETEFRHVLANPQFFEGDIVEESLVRSPPLLPYSHYPI